MENVEATGWSPRGVNFGNMRKVHLSTQLKSSDKTRWILRFLSLLVERTKENWLEEEKGRMHWLMSRKKSTDVRIWALDTAWFQPHMTPLGCSWALLPLNAVCFETPCGTQMAAAPSSLIATPFHSRRRAKQNCPHRRLGTSCWPQMSDLPPPWTHHCGQRDGINWLNHPNYMMGKEKRVVSQRRSKGAEGGRKMAVQNKRLML